MCNDFTHLHVHTDASPDGLMTVDALLKRAAELKFTHLAMTDHGTLANAVAFWVAANRHNVIPILGLEGYFLYNGNRHHITLNSVNETGFNNLIAINNYSHDKGWKSGYPTFGMEQLNEWNEGLVVATGCPASALHVESEVEGLQYVGDLVDIFGNDRVFAEEMFVMDKDIISRPRKAAKRFGLKTIITNDVHFPYGYQGRTHQIMTSCRKGYDYSSDDLFLKTPKEIVISGSSWADSDTLYEWMKNTQLIVEMVEPFSMKAEPTLPVEEGASEKLYDILLDKLSTHPYAIANPVESKERIEKEWSVLKKMGFLDYFYILNDIIFWAKEQGIEIGPGRGSAAGSFILYMLGITGVNPIEHGLLFERFLNTHRGEFPDVDVDFESERRQEVITYANEKWGAFPIATYNTYSHSSLVRDLGRVCKVDKVLVAKASEMGPESPAFEEFCSANEEILPAYNDMMGQIRHRGKHAGGVIITPRPIPIENTGQELVAAWTEGHEKELTLTGIVKYDLLGLTALTQLRAMREMSGAEPSAPVDGDPVFDIFKEGRVGGIFQWTGSDGIRELTMRVQPNSWEDLSAINALYRPGPLDSGMADQYPNYMRKPNKHHPRLDGILEETYGVIVYQEQVMLIVAEMMGGGFETADMARRVIVKYKPGDPDSETKVLKLERDFKKKSADRGFDTKTINTIWNEIVTFARYGFNKSHSVAYALIAWQMAWYKFHYPLVYYTALLQGDPANAQKWLFEAAAEGIPIVPPEINTSGQNYEMRDGKIFLPLSAIKFFGEKGVVSVIEEREANGPFTTYDDLDARISKRAMNSRVRKLMMQMDCFESLSGDPASFLPEYVDLPIIEDWEAQQEGLGFVLPNRRYTDWIARNSKGDYWVSGFVSEIKIKKSARGKFNVYYLIPNGVFWSRKEKYTDTIQVGDLIAVEKSSFGDALRVKRMKR